MTTINPLVPPQGQSIITAVKLYVDYYPIIFGVILLVWFVLYTQKREPQYMEDM